MKTNLKPTGKVLGGVGITDENTSLFLRVANSASIASFHLFQSERFLHSAIDFRSGSFWMVLTTNEAKFKSTTVVLPSNDSPEST
jgi:hypothetical protein